MKARGWLTREMLELAALEDFGGFTLLEKKFELVDEARARAASLCLEQQK